MKYKKAMKKKYEVPTVEVVEMEVTCPLASSLEEVQVHEDEEWDPRYSW